ncbi:MAG: hypothetical protein L3J65_02865 [Robiginitomaculum sp.]|nr:hypothetical protein [Robiginitomaculum sp.]
MTGQKWKNRLAASQLGLANSVSSDTSSGVNSFLAWLMLWFQYCLEHTHLQAQSRETVRRPYVPNRYWRRFGERDIAPAHDNRPYFILAGRNLTPGQFTEWLAHFSGRGRVCVYRMRYWRKTVKGKAAPLGTEHEYWRDPLGRIGKHMGRLPIGLWYGHLWPGWWAISRFEYYNAQGILLGGHCAWEEGPMAEHCVSVIPFSTKKPAAKICTGQVKFGGHWIREST